MAFDVVDVMTCLSTCTMCLLHGTDYGDMKKNNIASSYKKKKIMSKIIQDLCKDTISHPPPSWKHFFYIFPDVHNVQGEYEASQRENQLLSGPLCKPDFIQIRVITRP